MRIERKLEIFARVTMAEVEDERRQMEGELDSLYETALQNASDEEEKNSGARLRSERERLNKAKNKRLAEKTSEAKKSMLALREKLTEGLFEKVGERLRLFVESDGYPDYLLANIAQDCATSGKIFTSAGLALRDMKYSGEIKKTSGLNSVNPEIGFIGGYKLYSKDCRIVLDRTLDAKLEALRGEFSMLASNGGGSGER